MTDKCYRCSSTNLEAGTLKSTGGLSFYPKKPKFMSWRTSKIAIITNMCLDCGFIEIVGDLNKAHKLMPR